MVPITQHKNRHVIINQTSVVTEALAETFLSADIAAASGTLTVKDIAGFAVGKYVWINPFSPNSEIIAVHASTAPSGNTITLAANTSFAHSASEKVYYVEFNQVEISHASTLTGSKSVLTTTGLRAAEFQFEYLDTSQTSGYYFARFKDSVGTAFSSYSDGVIYDGWARSSAGYMVYRAMRDLKVKFTEDFTIQDCYDWIEEGMRDIQGKLRNWPELYVYNQIIGQTSYGSFLVTMPTDAFDTETGQSILELRVGDGKGLHYLSPNQFDAQLGPQKRTQVRTEGSAADTSLAVDNSYDFEDSGSASFYLSGTKYTFTYTGVTRDDADGGTAAFTGIPASGDGSLTVTVPVDTYIFQDEVVGVPTFFTIRGGNIEFDRLFDSDEANENIYLDYAKVTTAVNSQGDTIDYQRYDMLSAYLAWRIESVTKNNSRLDESSSYYRLYKARLNDAIRTLVLPKSKTAPNINTMSRGRRGRASRPDIQNLSVSEQ